MTVEETATFYEIEMACIILSAIFLVRTTKLSAMKSEIIENLADISYRDGLTSLYNYRFLDDNKSILFSTDNNDNIVVAFIDVDNFKQFNDNYGHKFGDKVLCSIADVLVKSTKALNNTYVIRVGGDEFVVVGLNVNYKCFVDSLTNALKRVSGMKLRYEQKDVGINISIGIADGDKRSSFMKIYNRADENLLKAKNGGKNVIVL
jgi:diguanylate cyclase (GGDEF)-like protein